MLMASDERGEPAENLAPVSCTECGRKPHAGELWRLLFADIGEVVIYCPACAQREFGRARDSE
jgi:hypothetical protein